MDCDWCTEFAPFVGQMVMIAVLDSFDNTVDLCENNDKITSLLNSNNMEANDVTFSPYWNNIQFEIF